MSKTTSPASVYALSGIHQALLAALLIYYPVQASSLTRATPAINLESGKDSSEKNVRAESGQDSESLLLEVTINSQKLDDIIRVEKLADGRLALPVDAWSEARLRPAGDKLALPDGYEGYVLNAVAGLEYKFDGAKLTLDINAPPEAFEASSIKEVSGGEAPPNLATPGGYLNYNLNATQSGDSGTSYGAALESVAFNSLGSLVNGGVLLGNNDQLKFVRTESYIQKDLPGTMETLLLGDAIGSSGSWIRSVRFGGIRWSRNFALRPGYFTFPMPTISGSATLPSTVDVLINNQRQLSQTVNPGPFDLTNVPVVTGAGEINLVVRDMLGIERQVTQSYYTSPILLAAGLSDFSFEAGLFRENFGSQSFSYSTGFGAGTWRQGLSDKLTGEVRLEAQQHRQAAGFGLAGLLGTYAVAEAAAAYSNAGSEQGGQYLLGLSRTSPRGGGSLLWQYFDRSYTQFGSLPDEIRPRDRFSASYGMPLFWGASAGVSYISQSNWNEDPFQLVSASFNLSLPWNAYLSVFTSRQLDENNGWSGGLNLNLPLGTQRSISFSSSRDASGHFINAMQASQSAPQGPGLGWRLRASDDTNQLLQGGATVNTNYGQLTADANMGKDSNALRLGVNGSIGWLQSMPFATRDLGHGSFAVVKVGDLKDVKVYRSNQLAATTNSSGLALVPNMLPYQDNQITIDPGELPFDIEIKGVKEIPLPYARSGVFVEFPVRRSRNALVVLRQPNGKPVPVGAHVIASPSGKAFFVAKRGQVYLTDLENDNRITVKWKDGRCKLAIKLAADGPAEPRIGPLACGD